MMDKTAQGLTAEPFAQPAPAGAAQPPATVSIEDQLRAAEDQVRNAQAAYADLAWLFSRTVHQLAERQAADSPTAWGLALAAMRAFHARSNLKLFLGDLFVAARRSRLRPKDTVRLFQDIRLVRDSGWLDSEYYAPQKARTPIPDFEDARNYVLVGQGLDPNRLFSAEAYLRLNPDVRAAGLDPLIHFLRNGAPERRPVAASSRFSPAEVEDRTQYLWPCASGAQADTPHARRPDDSLLAEGEAGRAFMARYALLGPQPDFAGAVEEIKRAARSSLTGPQSPRPTASIIIPIYGQLPYTLNCLHALMTHKTAVSFEVLIGDDASPDESEKYLNGIPRVRYVRHVTNSGFVDNCNTTAALARGRYIVLLNNDTRVAPGWLDELIGSFDLFPKAGLVGSKLYYEDGVLQEAGGIFWQDGSAWNYGRGDDPNRPGYCYARQADYVSGAAIAIPRDLWQALGGFDEIYRPAYAEDADIAFRIRALGRQTWMQPQSRAIHYEGRTSGTDITQGAKAYQVANLKTLAERWAKTLSAHRPNGVAPMLERDRVYEKRVLVIDATTPTPREDAGSVLTVSYMQLYQELGYKVHFIPLHNFLYLPGATDDLMRMGVECAYYPYYPTLETFLREWGARLDLVQVFRVGVAEESLDLLRYYAPQAPVIFHNVDMHYLRMERQAAIEDDGALMEAAKDMKARELALIDSVDCAVVLSTVEEDILKVETPDADVEIFPFMTPLMGTSVGFAPRQDVMFVGGYRHQPNVDAALFLARDVWPLVRGRLPGARLLLVGAHPPQEVKDLAGPDIEVTGQVEDLRPYFDGARVFAATIRYGAGIKGKVATAMSYGVPVVATTIAAEGMFLVDGRDVSIADDAKTIARSILEIYEDPAKWARLSQNGLTFVDQNNSSAMGRRLLSKIIHRATWRHARRTVAKVKSEHMV